MGFRRQQWLVGLTNKCSERELNGYKWKGYRAERWKRLHVPRGGGEIGYVSAERTRERTGGKSRAQSHAVESESKHGTATSRRPGTVVNGMSAHLAGVDVALGAGAGRVFPFDGSGADALVPGEGGPPAALAREDDAFTSFTTDAERAADASAVATFASRGAAAAGVESFGGVDTLV